MTPTIPGLKDFIADVAAGRLRGTEAFDELVARIAAHETPDDASDEARQRVIEQAVQAVSQDRALCKLLFADDAGAAPKQATSEPAPKPEPAPKVEPEPEPKAEPAAKAKAAPKADDDDDVFDDDDDFFGDDDDDDEDGVVPLPLTDEEIDAELEAIEREREARLAGEFDGPRSSPWKGVAALAAVVVGGGVAWYLTRPDSCDKLAKSLCLEGNTKSCETVAFSKALADKQVGEDKCASVSAALEAAVEGKSNKDRARAFNVALVDALGFDPRGENAPKISDPTPKGPPPPTVVVEGQLGMVDLFLDNAHVYWTSTQPPGVFRVRNIGGAVEAYGAQADAIDVMPTKDFVYWVARSPQGSQVWVDKVRGKHDANPLTLEGFSPTRAAFAEGEFAFIDGVTGAVMMAAVDGTPPRELVPGRGSADDKGKQAQGPAALPTELAVDAAHVYVLSPAPVSTVWAVPRDGQAPPRALATGQASPRTLTLDATHVYWVEASAGAITRVPKTGGVPEVLATGQAGAGGLATDAANVYWTSTAAGTVHAVPKAGGEITTIATGLSEPRFVAVGPAAVFWESGGTVFRQGR